MNRKLFPVLMICFLLLAGCAPGTIPPQTASPLPQQDSPSALPTAAVTDTVSAPVSTPPQFTASQSAVIYPIVDTSQGKCYDNTIEIPCSQASFIGQDAQYTGNAPRYQDNDDGTVTDLVTGLMWQQDPGAKMTFDQAVAGAASFKLADHSDWRLPTIKELYSLILFDGTDVSGCNGTCSVTPFIDTRYFKFQYGDTSAGERVIDSQFASSTKYVSSTMNGNETVFGVNFADGRIKGYPIEAMPGQSQGKLFYVLYVRGNASYGQNSFTANGDDTVTDTATGLTWMKSDSGKGMNWESALNYCENLNFGGSSDWRLPNVKELQSIVDYSRSPATSNSAAIDPVFSLTAITNEAGQTDYPYYWSSTTHADSSGRGAFAAYVAFGRALGYMNSWMDVHGAGAQRSDPKTGSASAYPQGHGPQGDAIRIENYVRCIRSGDATSTPNGTVSETRPTMQIESTGINHGQQGGMKGQDQPPMGGTPPQEAINACSASIQGASCSFTVPNGTVSGACQTIQQQLACVPANRP